MNTTSTTSTTSTNLIEKYIESLNALEKIALEIARNQLESSFNIEKSIGFLEWKSKYLINVHDQS